MNDCALSRMSERSSLPKYGIGFASALRSVRRRENGILAHLRSIDWDATFLEEVYSRFSRTSTDIARPLPIYANQRCGTWYAPTVPPAYFKSTDGHAGSIAFSLTRLNLHFAVAACTHGGALLVDATKNGKTFPDSLTRTVSIWASILSSVALGGDPSDYLTLPPWISASETALIESMLPGMRGSIDAATMSTIRSALRVYETSAGAAAAGDNKTTNTNSCASGTTPASSALLGRPLVPVWIKRTRMGGGVIEIYDPWLDKVLRSRKKTASPLAGLVEAINSVSLAGRIPLFLISASLSESSVTGSLRSSISVEGGAEEDMPGSPFASSSSKNSQQSTSVREEWRELGSPSIASTTVLIQNGHGWTYIAGAGDDAENWSGPLTPHLWQKHREELLTACDDEECFSILDACIMRDRERANNHQHKLCGTTGIFSSSAASATTIETAQISEPASVLRCSASFSPPSELDAGALWKRVVTLRDTAGLISVISGDLSNRDYFALQRGGGIIVLFVRPMELKDGIRAGKELTLRREKLHTDLDDSKGLQEQIGLEASPEEDVSACETNSSSASASVGGASTGKIVTSSKSAPLQSTVVVSGKEGDGEEEEVGPVSASGIDDEDFLPPFVVKWHHRMCLEVSIPIEKEVWSKAKIVYSDEIVPELLKICELLEKNTAGGETAAAAAASEASSSASPSETLSLIPRGILIAPSSTAACRADKDICESVVAILLSVMLSARRGIPPQASFNSSVVSAQLAVGGSLPSRDILKLLRKGIESNLASIVSKEV